MYDTEAYLRAIGFSGPVYTEPKTLRKLHRVHMMAIPYNDARTVGRGTPVPADAGVDLDEIFDTAVLRRCGGVCLELNTLFRRLLRELGFQAEYLSAGVRRPDGGFGPDLEHLILGVRLTGTLWLVDVGFAGPGYLEPLRVGEGVQTQFGCDYRVVRADSYLVVERRARGGGWSAVYRLRDQARTVEDWSRSGAGNREDGAQAVRGAPGAGSTVTRSRALENGQMVLVGRRLLTVEDGHERVSVLAKTADFDQAVDLIMGQADR
ncbi:MAG TPA: arylamine N-acetyltransferase [Actinocrinis sp.]|nr:arylamine N-acetyltransferase [Actinocrinis sp.]